MLALAAALSFFIGLSLGLLGAGGGILMIPMLVYVVGLEPRRAIVTSLVVVGATSFMAMVPHARARRVRFGVAIVFGLAGMVGAFGGGRLAKLIPSSVLLLGLATMMILSASTMLRKRSEGTGTMSLPKGALVGTGVGFVAGMVGAGGGFLIVPALVFFGGLPITEAIGTSLLVITMQCAAATVGHIAHTSLDWALVGAVGTSSIVGSLVGARVSPHVAPEKLRLAFAWVVVAMAMLTVGKELVGLGVPKPFAIGAVAAIPLALALVAVRARSRSASDAASRRSAA